MFKYEQVEVIKMSLLVLDFGKCHLLETEPLDQDAEFIGV
jgi:hypothetical protein